MDGEQVITRRARWLRGALMGCAGLTALSLGLMVYVGGTIWRPRLISREGAARALGLVFPAGVPVRAYYQAPPPPGFCMAELRLSPDQFTQFTATNRLRWHPARSTDRAVQMVERMGSELLARMKLWRSPLPQPLLLDDQRYLAYDSKLHTRRWIREGEERPTEFDSTIHLAVFAYHEIGGTVRVLCFQYG